MLIAMGSTTRFLLCDSLDRLLTQRVMQLQLQLQLTDASGGFLVAPRHVEPAALSDSYIILYKNIRKRESEYFHLCICK